MDLTPDQLDELLGAWALNALEPDEQAAVEVALASHPDLAARARQLAEVVAVLGRPNAQDPPPGLREAILDQAAATRPAAPASDPVILLEHRIDDFAATAAAMTPARWDRPAEPYPWTAHGLVAHLLVIERYTARQLGLTADPPLAGGVGHLDLGPAEIEAELGRPPADTVADWEQAARAVIDGLRGDDRPDLEAIVDFHGWPFPVASLLITRAFEIWTHAEDLSRAGGLTPGRPSAEDLRTMSAFSIGTLPLVSSLDHTGVPLEPARIVLTGDGGGTFDLGSGGEPRAVLVLDVLDYCRLAARRAQLDQLDAVIEGDPAVARRLAAAAQFLAL